MSGGEWRLVVMGGGGWWWSGGGWGGRGLGEREGSTFQKQHPFSQEGPGGVVRELDSVGAPKSVRGNWPLWSPVASGGLP